MTNRRKSSKSKLEREDTNGTQTFFWKTSAKTQNYRTVFELFSWPVQFGAGQLAEKQPFGRYRKLFWIQFPILKVRTSLQRVRDPNENNRHDIDTMASAALPPPLPP